MAYELRTKYLEEEDAQQQGRERSVEQPAVVAYGGAPGLSAPLVPGRASVVRSAGAAPAAGGGGGKFVNFERYLSANRDAVDRTANELAGGIDREGAAAQSAIAPAVQGFMRQVDAAGFTDKGIYTPEQHRAFASKTYAGPTDFNKGREALQKQAYGVADRAQQLGTVSGVQAVQGGRGGSGRLDAALMRTTAGGRLDTLKSKYGGLDTFFDTQAADANRHAGAVAGLTAEAAEFHRGRAERADKVRELNKDDPPYFDPLSLPALPAQPYGSNAGHGKLGSTTVSLGEEQIAQHDGLFKQWVAAGRPPYDAWKKSIGR